MDRKAPANLTGSYQSQHLPVMRLCRDRAEGQLAPCPTKPAYPLSGHIVSGLRGLTRGFAPSNPRVGWLTGSEKQHAPA